MSPRKGNNYEENTIKYQRNYRHRSISPLPRMEGNQTKGAGWERSSTTSHCHFFDEYRAPSETYPEPKRKIKKPNREVSEPRTEAKGKIIKASQHSIVDKSAVTQPSKKVETCETRMRTCAVQAKKIKDNASATAALGINAGKTPEKIPVHYQEFHTQEMFKGLLAQNSNIMFASNDDEKETIYKMPGQRRMELLIATSSFRWKNPIKESDSEISSTDIYSVAGSDANPWDVSGAFEDENKEKSSIKTCRVELKQSQVPLNGELDGRIFFDLENDVVVNSIDLEVDYNLVFVHTDGEFRRQDASKSWKIRHLGFSNDIENITEAPQIDTINKVSKAVKLNPGTSAIPFRLTISKINVPSFNYMHKNGVMTLSTYAIRAVADVSGKKVSTHRVAFNVPSSGMEGQPVVTEDAGELQLGLLNKYVTHEMGPSFVAGDLYGKGKEVTMVITRTIRCAALDINEDIETVALEKFKKKKLKKHKVAAMPVLDQLIKLGKPLKGSYKAVVEQSNVPFVFTLPSVSVGGFTCDYNIQLKHKAGSYETKLIACDQLYPSPFRPEHVTKEALDSFGWLKNK